MTKRRPPKPRAAQPAVRDPQAAREAERYAHPIPSREAILKLLIDSGQLMKAGALAEALGLRDERDLVALDKRLAAMLRDGQLLKNRRDGFGVASRLDLIPGEILANAEGYGFLRPDGGGDDLYLSPAEMRKVMHGDRVLASVVGVDHRGRRRGAVVEVLQRRPSRLVGRVAVERGVTVVVPDDERLHLDILIPPGKDGGARAGQIVVAEITDPPDGRVGPIGRVLTVLGDKLVPSLLVEMAVAEYGLPHEWAPEVTAEVSGLAVDVSAADRAGRVDLRELPLVTIDGADSKDFDDAVFAAARDDGWRLVVAIADVSHYVTPGTALDVAAQDRATSVYFPGFVVPMLPAALSNGICSLNPDVDRLCMACDMQVSRDGLVTRSKFYPAVMRSHARLTYDEVWQIIGPKDKATRARRKGLATHLDQLYRLYKAFAKARKRRGTIEFEAPEAKFRLDESGEVQSVDVTPRNDAHKLIEECMIAANVEAAKFLTRRRLPAPYRVHAQPPVDKYEDLLEFLRQYKLKLPPADKVTPADYSALLAKVQDRPEYPLIQNVLLRSLALAVYLPENQGHFGLALAAYTHFTSPIRRYPDLLVHRAIRYGLAAGTRDAAVYSEAQMATLCTHCSQRARRAEEAERDVDERFKCAWMEKHVGEEFVGHVSGVTSFGLFVDLDESHVSGLVHITQLPNDYYHFDPARRLLEGEHSGRVFRLGDAVRIQVLRASLEDRKIDFRLVREPVAAPSTARRNRNRSHKA